MNRVLAFLLALSAVLSAQDEPRLAEKGAFAGPRELGGFSAVPGFFKRVFLGIRAEEERWSRPMSAARSGDTWFVCDSGARTFWVISRTEKKAFKAAPPGGWGAPMDLALGGGFCFVSDPDAGAVWAYAIKDRAWSRVPGEFRRPTGLGWSASHGALLVADTEAHALLAWDGKSTVRLASQGLNFPTDAAELDADTVVVADSMNHELDFLNWKGERTGGFGSAGDALGYFAFIRSVAVDGEGRIYVSDVQKDWIQVFRRDGQLLTAYGGPGTLHHPSYLNLDLSSLWVADSFARRIVELEWK